MAYVWMANVTVMTDMEDADVRTLVSLNLHFTTMHGFTFTFLIYVQYTAWLDCKQYYNKQQYLQEYGMH